MDSVSGFVVRAFWGVLSVLVSLWGSLHYKPLESGSTEDKVGR